MAKNIENKQKKPANYLLGIFFLIISIFLSLSLASFNIEDPSFNRATDIEAHNLAGSLGAYIADPSIQFFGFSAYFIIVVMFIWGVKNLINFERKIIYLAKLPLLFIFLLSTSCFLSYFKIKNNIFLSSYGGVIGELMRSTVQTILTHKAYVIVLSLTLSIALFGYLIGYKLSLKILQNLYLFLNVISLLIIGTLKKLYNLFSKDKDEEIIVVRESEEISGELEEGKTPKLSRKLLKAKKQESILKPIKDKIMSAHGEYVFPAISFLALPAVKDKKTTNQVNLNQNARLLEQVLSDFGVSGSILNIFPGPVVTLYELEPAAGTKSSRVIGLADDIARSMSALSTRIAVIPGKNALGIEIPNQHREVVYLRELLESENYTNNNLNLPIVLGKDISGDPVIVDLARMPHLLVAGTTGSGKSVAINTMILSLLYKLSPSECKFIMIDPKMLELSVYEGIPHLLSPVVTEPGKAIVALKWTVKEMENRYKLMSSLGVRNIAGYNEKIREAKEKGETLERIVQTGFNPETGKPIMEKVPLSMEQMPFIVVVVDEMADLMIVAGKEIESSIQRLAQMARAAGIHIIMATQRPSVDVITGVIKANFPTRISFQVTSRIDSRTILGEPGAEQLLGMGDMLYMSGGSRITRVHGPFVNDAEVEKVVMHLKEQGEPSYVTEVTESTDDDSSSFLSGGDGSSSDNDLYKQAVEIVRRDRKVSTSYIQRSLRIGYNRAALIIEQMEKAGLISKANHVGKREILMPEYDD